MEGLEPYEKELTELNDLIWDAAELKFREFRSAEAMAGLLERHGFRITRGLAHMPTAFLAEYGTGKPVIAILGEYDALSGLSQEAGTFRPLPRKDCANGHGCGHSLLGTAAAGAGLLLKAYLEDHPGKGTVRVYGCPAEEGGSGKTYMVREGLFQDVDGALTWHPGTQNEVMVGSNQANIQASFSFRGRAAHAAAAPQNGRSALDAVELMDVGVNYLREHMADYERVHYAILDAGGVSPNVVQPKAEVLYLIRSRTNEETRRLYERVVNIARGAALMTETEMTVRFDKAVSNIIPNRVLGQVLHDAMERVGVPVRTGEEKAFLGQFQELAGEERVLKDPGMAPFPDPGRTDPERPLRGLPPALSAHQCFSHGVIGYGGCKLDHASGTVCCSLFRHRYQRPFLAVGGPGKRERSLEGLFLCGPGPGRRGKDPVWTAGRAGSSQSRTAETAVWPDLSMPHSPRSDAESVWEIRGLSSKRQPLT